MKQGFLYLEIRFVKIMSKLLSTYNSNLTWFQLNWQKFVNLTRSGWKDFYMQPFDYLYIKCGQIFLRNGLVHFCNKYLIGPFLTCKHSQTNKAQTIQRMQLNFNPVSTESAKHCIFYERCMKNILHATIQSIIHTIWCNIFLNGLVQFCNKYLVHS